MRTMIGIKLTEFPLMCIPVSTKLAKSCPNLYHCTHSNGNLAEPHTHCTRISQESAFYRESLNFLEKERKYCVLDGKHRKNVHFYCFRACPNPICRRRAEERAAMTTLSPPLKWTIGNVAEIAN